MSLYKRTCLLLSCSLLCAKVYSVELYLPLKLDPLFDSKIEKLFVLANMPIIKRPLPLSHVREALNRIKHEHPTLATSIQRHLKRYDAKLGISHLQLSISAPSGEPQTLSNQRGMDTSANYSSSFSGFWQATDWLVVNAGFITSNKESAHKSTFAEGSYLSIGNEYLQADIGMRPHWLGPFQESDMLLSSNAAALPSITFSNTTAVTVLGFSYEIFFAEMSESYQILSDDRTERRTGNPKIFGVHTSFEPTQGVAISFNRLLQYGGADRDDSFKSLMNAFFKVKANDNSGIEGNDFGNQVSSIATRYTFTGDVPLAIYMEYAGEDTSRTSEVHLGNTSLMLGLHMPKITQNLDVTYEFAEWQNGWYVNGNYGDGLRQHGSIIGHWGAEHREFTDAAGATAHTAKLNWYIDNDAALTTTYRQLTNAPYAHEEYSTGYQFSGEYHKALNKFAFGVSLILGNTVYDEEIAAISGTVRW